MTDFQGQLIAGIRKLAVVVFILLFIYLFIF